MALRLEVHDSLSSISRTRPATVRALTKLHASQPPNRQPSTSATVYFGISGIVLAMLIALSLVNFIGQFVEIKRVFKDFERRQEGIV